MNKSMNILGSLLLSASFLVSANAFAEEAETAAPPTTLTMEELEGVMKEVKLLECINPRAVFLQQQNLEEEEFKRLGAAMVKGCEDETGYTRVEGKDLFETLVKKFGSVEKLGEAMRNSRDKHKELMNKQPPPPM